MTRPSEVRNIDEAALSSPSSHMSSTRNFTFLSLPMSVRSSAQNFPASRALLFRRRNARYARGHCFVLEPGQVASLPNPTPESWTRSHGHPICSQSQRQGTR
jgi:hypothetical protein